MLGFHPPKTSRAEFSLLSYLFYFLLSRGGYGQL